MGTEVPIEFKEGKVKTESNRTSRHRPVFGGIQLWTALGAHTLGFRATHSDGTVGLVMSGHRGGVGVNVWQPTQQTNNFLGRVAINPHPGPRQSDAAFVPTIDVIPRIWPQRPISEWVSYTYTPPGTIVMKEGIMTGYSIGIIQNTGVTVPSEMYTTLWSQVLATYPSAGGDSGGPVFSTDAFGNARVYGIHVGRFENQAVYSPVDGIWWDLWVRWGSQ